MRELILKIEGMTCGHCVESVRKALEATEGVKTISINLEAGLARVSFDAQRVGLSEIEQAVKDAGYVLVGTTSAASDE